MARSRTDFRDKLSREIHQELLESDSPYHPSSNEEVAPEPREALERFRLGRLSQVHHQCPDDLYFKSVKESSGIDANHLRPSQ